MHGGGGFWNFLASINPFESWRKYLVFRHKRDQDHRYREHEEARRLKLENDARELALDEKRLKIAKQIGATPEQLKPVYDRILGCEMAKAVTPPTVTIQEPPLLTDGKSDGDGRPASWQ